MRQDAWTSENDAILADITLRHIQEGSTQLAAFEEVAKKLSRTPAACGYRWNANVRKLYLNDIGLAKKIRKERRSERSEMNAQVDLRNYSVQATLTWNSVLRFLRIQRQEYQAMQNGIRQLEREIETSKEESLRLTHDKEELEEKIQKLSEEYMMIRDDYKALLGIVERARERVRGLDHP